MSEQQYFGASQQDKVEMERLRLLEELYDPHTIRHLNTIEIFKGWNCLEVGAGAGSVAQWLCTRVGTEGKVVATDINTRFLRQLNAPNLETRQHDILKDELETGVFDLVHCRCLLMHLPEPEKAMRRMANAVRPGGWLIVEELDYGSLLSADIGNPAAAVFTSAFRALFEFLRKNRVLDAYFGRQIPNLLEQIDYDDIGQEGLVMMVKGGGPEGRWGSMSLRAAARPMIDAGLLTKDQHETVQRLFGDATFSWPSSTFFAAWGRRPVEAA